MLQLRRHSGGPSIFCPKACSAALASDRAKHTQHPPSVAATRRAGSCCCRETVVVPVPSSAGCQDAGRGLRRCSITDSWCTQAQAAMLGWAICLNTCLNEGAHPASSCAGRRLLSVGAPAAGHQVTAAMLSQKSSAAAVAAAWQCTCEDAEMPGLVQAHDSPVSRVHQLPALKVPCCSLADSKNLARQVWA